MDSDFEMATTHIKQYLITKDTSFSKTGLDPGIETEICRISKELYDETNKILNRNKEKLLFIKKILYESETGKLSSQELKELLNDHKVN